MKKVHFIGVGGIGISALAKIYLQQGCQISGSDLKESDILSDLQKQGADLAIGAHKKSFLPNDTNLVVFSPAIEDDNPELKKAKEKNISIMSYPQALGELVSKHWTIAVSGTHGKSTTTAMLALIAIEEGLDPTVVVGTKLKEFEQGNVRIGKGKYLIIEADEFKESFLYYWPKAILLTNIEEDHLSYYRDLNHILESFQEYINHLPEDGVLAFNKKDKNISKLKFNNNWQTLPYGNLQSIEAQKLKKILQIPGKHNIINALSALAISRGLNIKQETVFNALAKFEGVWRRFEIIQQKPFVLISDYAHHPTEIKATLQAAKEKFPNQRIICVYQPHQYQRTKDLFQDFITAFDKADKIILSEIFNVAGREDENIVKSISSKDLVDQIQNRGKSAVFVEKPQQAAEYLRGEIKDNDVVLIIGAGDIWEIVNSGLSTS